MLPTTIPHTPVSSAAASSRATKLHSWQMMAQQVQPSCLLAYPNAADSDTPHQHTDECFKHLRGPLNQTTCTNVSSSTSAPTDTASTVASVASKLSKENCKKLEESLDLYHKLTVSILS